MVNIELQLLATMLHTGQFEPIARGEFTESDCLTNEGKILCNFVQGFRQETDGAARFPSLSIVKSRFANAAFVIPDPSPADNVPALMHEVKLQKARADMRTIAQELMDGAESDNPFEVLQRQSAVMKAMSTKVNPLRHITLADGVVDLFVRYTEGELMPTGIPWLWPTIQKYTKGAQRKEFVAFVGRPKSRKTFTAMSEIAFAVTLGYRGLIFTPEMPPPQVFMRFVAMMAKIRYMEFKNAELDDAELARFCELVDRFGRASVESPEQYAVRMRTLFDKEGLPDHAIPGIDIIQSTNKPVSWLQAQIQEHGADIVLCDSFYRQAPDHERKNDSETSRMTHVSRSMKDMAMEENIALLGTHQINRAGNKIVGDLSNVALSDAVGQDCDAVIRVITGKVNGSDCSALVFLGAREVPIDGVLIHNKPCVDFSEIGAITNKEQVTMLMQQEQEADDKEEAEKAKAKAAAGKFNPTGKNLASKKTKDSVASAATATAGRLGKAKAGA